MKSKKVRSENIELYPIAMFVKAKMHILTRCVNGKHLILVVVINILTLAGQTIVRLIDPLGSKYL